MAKVEVYKIDGSKVEVMELPDQLFGQHIDSSLVSEALRVQQANSRIAYANIKDRSEVRGGGRKPWKQKGTGRARHGSRRSPIWIGGGVTFGPTKMRNFFLKMNKKAKRKALAGILSDKVNAGQFIIIDDVKGLKTTKSVAGMRKVLPGADKTATFVAGAQEKGFVRGAKNLPKTRVMAAHSINVRDLLSGEYIIASKSAVNKMIEIYSA